MSELDPAESVLKEYLFSIGKSWWTKVLKKVTESIYKEEIHVTPLHLFKFSFNLDR